MLDPITSLNLACNVLELVKFGGEIATGAYQAFKTGQTHEDADLDAQLKLVPTFISQFDTPGPNFSGEGRALCEELKAKCHNLAVQLQDILKQDYVVRNASKRAALSAAMKSRAHRGKKRELKRRLDECLSLLQSLVRHTDRAINEAKLYQVCSQLDLNTTVAHSLQLDIEVLRRNLNNSCNAPAIQSQIAHLIKLTRKTYEDTIQWCIYDSLGFIQIHDRFEEVPKKHANTFQWILDSDQNTSFGESHLSFLRWLQSGQGIFHIAGKLGSGKSVLMKYICEDNRTIEYLTDWASEKRLVIAKYFFSRPGVRLQCSIDGLYRTILCEILTTCPELLPLVFPGMIFNEISDPVHRCSDPHLTGSQCERALEQILTSTDVYHKYRFCFFIDGLDEFLETSQQDYLDLTQILRNWAGISDGVKLCVSSREWTVFKRAFAEDPHLRLQEFTRHDIEEFARDRMDLSEQFPDENRYYLETLIQEVLEKADGVFLWVSLVVKALRRGIADGDRPVDLRRKVQSIPKGMNDLFRYLLNTIEVPDRQKAYCFFATVIQNQWEEESEASESGIFLTDVSLFQLSFIEDIVEDPIYVDMLTEAYKPWNTAQIIARVDRAREVLAGCCRGLLEEITRRPVVEGIEWRAPEFSHYAQFTHRTIYEYLQENSQSDMQRYTDGFRANIAVCQTGLIEAERMGDDYIAQRLLRRWRFKEDCWDDDSNLLTIGFVGDMAGIMQNILLLDRLDLLERLDTALQQAQHHALADFDPKHQSITLFDGSNFHPFGDGYTSFASVFYNSACLGAYRYIIDKVARDSSLVGNLSKKALLYRSIEAGMQRQVPGTLLLLEWFFQTQHSPNAVLYIKNRWDDWNASPWQHFLGRALLGQVERGSTISAFHGDALRIFLEAGADPDLTVCLEFRFNETRGHRVRSTIAQYGHTLTSEQDISERVFTERLASKDRQGTFVLRNLVIKFVHPNQKEPILDLIDRNMNIRKELEEQVHEELKWRQTIPRSTEQI